MNSRRTFIESMAGLAGAMTVPSSVLGANDRIRIGVIGPGSQGSFITKQAIVCAGTEIVAFATTIEDPGDVAL